MSARLPHQPSESEAEGMPDPGFAAPGQLEAGDTQSTLEPSHDTATAVDDFGTTGLEERTGESLDARIAREEDDVLVDVELLADESEGADNPFSERSGQHVGRLVAPDEGAHTDTESELLASDVGTDLGGYSAEESAMHLEPEG